MNDAAPSNDTAPGRARNAAKARAPQLDGEVTYISIPHPPPAAMNKNRPISDLIKAQLRHVQHAESARLPKEKRDGRLPKDIHTEAEAASYIAAVTKILHPQGRKRSRKKPGN